MTRKRSPRQEFCRVLCHLQIFSFNLEKESHLSTRILTGLNQLIKLDCLSYLMKRFWRKICIKINKFWALSYRRFHTLYKLWWALLKRFHRHLIQTYSQNSKNPQNVVTLGWKLRRIYQCSNYRNLKLNQSRIILLHLLRIRIINKLSHRSIPRSKEIRNHRITLGLRNKTRNSLKASESMVGTSKKLRSTLETAVLLAARWKHANFASFTRKIRLKRDPTSTIL